MGPPENRAHYGVVCYGSGSHAWSSRGVSRRSRRHYLFGSRGIIARRLPHHTNSAQLTARSELIIVGHENSAQLTARSELIIVGHGCQSCCKVPMCVVLEVLRMQQEVLAMCVVLEVLRMQQEVLTMQQAEFIRF
jgi:hypothetical protein